MTSTPPPKIDWQAQLARERNRIAADRTLLAWVRTSLILIGIGFGVDQVVQIITTEVGSMPNPARFSKLLASYSVGLGTLAMIGAIQDYRGEIHRLSQPEYIYQPRQPLGVIVAVAIITGSLVVALNIGVKLMFGNILD
ncbi:MAG: DUF202 domain-containing protein [Leptolyngbyaceae cyanobacterium SM2_3_12]|nr:DUF202 domain-containing protein [Leptolyngbyaceae cyanobacterium SM2_3_12]